MWPYLTALPNLLAAKKLRVFVLLWGGEQSPSPSCVCAMQQGKQRAEAIHLTSGKVMPQGEKIDAAVPAALLNLSPSISSHED